MDAMKTQQGSLGLGTRVSGRICLAGVLSLWAINARAAVYTVTDLGTPSGQTNTFATSINNNGEVAINGDTRPQLYTGSSYVGITSLANNSDLLQQVNNGGLAVGTSTDSSGNPQAVYASATGPTTMTKLATLTAGGQGYAFGVSPTGAFGAATIVGASLNGGGQFQAVTWTGTSTITALVPSNTSAWDNTGGSEAYAMNSLGVIVGQAAAAGTEHPDAFVTGSGGIFKDIAPATSTQSLSEAINSAGFVVGRWQDLGGDQFAFVYSPTTGLTIKLFDLATPPNSDPYSTDAEAINASGQIVGQSLTSADSEEAVLFNASGQVTDLNSLIPSGSGWTLTNAASINDAGDIVGTGTFGGKQEAFLLTPSALPEPTSAVMLAGASLILLGRRRRAI